MAPASDLGVVIATRDRRAQLLDALGRITTLAERPEVVVVDNGSADGTARAVRERFPGVRVATLPRDRGAAARNVGVEMLDTPYVAFSDDDSWWAPGGLARAGDLLRGHPRVAVVAARVLVGEDERLDPTCAAMARSPLHGGDTGPGPAVLGFVACGAVVRREAFLAVGGFDERYGIGGEEARLALALAVAGWELRYVAEVIAHHHPTPSPTRADRAAQVLRNDLWTAWSARPLAASVRATGRLLRAAGSGRVAARGLLGAVRGGAWILRERRPAPPRVERELRTLERAPASGATGPRREA